MSEYLLGDLMLYAFFAIMVIACVLDYQWRHDRRVRERREKRLCTRCGFPVPGNVSGVCPACGMRVGRA